MTARKSPHGRIRPGPKQSLSSIYADVLGVKIKSIRRVGGGKRLMSMAPEARLYMEKLAKGDR